MKEGGHDRGAEPQRRAPAGSHRERRERIEAVALARPQIGEPPGRELLDVVTLLADRHRSVRENDTKARHDGQT